MSAAGAGARPTLLGVVHQQNAGPGSFGALVDAAGYDLEIASFADGPPPGRPLDGYSAVIVFGGSQQVDQEDRHPWLTTEKRAIGEALEQRVPLLGVCLGAQLLAEVAGAEVGPTGVPRRGWGEVEAAPEAGADPIFARVPARFTTVVWHSYEFKLPPGATPLARTETALQGFRLPGLPAWGVQFHPEAEPEGVARWVGDLREANPDVPEDELAMILADSERHRSGQETLAARVCHGFLEASVNGR